MANSYTRWILHTKRDKYLHLEKCLFLPSVYFISKIKMLLSLLTAGSCAGGSIPCWATLSKLHWICHINGLIEWSEPSALLSLCKSAWLGRAAGRWGGLVRVRLIRDVRLTEIHDPRPAYLRFLLYSSDNPKQGMVTMTTNLMADQSESCWI